MDRSPIFDADSAGDGWRRFHALFPNAQGYVAVSAPVYPGQTATIDVTANCGDVCGFGWLVQLTQQAIAWEVRDARLVWVS